MADSSLSTSDELCDHLRSLGSPGLVQLLSERRDVLVEPLPRTLNETAERLLRPGSVQQAATQLSLPWVEVAEALAAPPAPCPRPLLASMLGVPLGSGQPARGVGADLEQALDRLSALGLVWARAAAPGEPDILIMAEALRELWTRPLGLRSWLVGFEAVVENLRGEDLAAALDALALTAEGAESEQRAALLAHHRDGPRVRDLVAQAPAPAQELLNHLREHNSTMYSSISLTSAGKEGQEWAAARALLSSEERPVSPGLFGYFGEQQPELPAEVLIALRGPEPAAPFHPRRPQIPLTDVTGQQPAEDASAAAVTFLAQTATVLLACVRRPPALLKNGGIGPANSPGSPRPLPVRLPRSVSSSNAPTRPVSSHTTASSGCWRRRRTTSGRRTSSVMSAACAARMSSARRRNRGGRRRRGLRPGRRIGLAARTGVLRCRLAPRHDTGPGRGPRRPSPLRARRRGRGNPRSRNT